MVVLALPRGGVPVAYEVARALDAPFGVLVARKLGVPGHEEYAMGAIAPGVFVIDKDLIRSRGLDLRTVQRVADRELHELRRREAAYLEGREPPELRDKTVILVDDGLATGATMRAAAAAVRRQSPARVVVATPVASEEACDAFRDIVDDVICVLTPRPFQAVGLWYDDFTQTSDAEVRALLARAAEARDRAAGTGT